jgi:hypothetical protein
MRINGLTDAGDAGRAVTIDRQDLTGTWVRVATTTVDDEGRFTALWRTDTIGRVVLRAIVAREGSATAAGDPLTAQVTIFRPAIASWYGPGFFGRQTACGTRLTRKTVGVAHKTLPCGTPVELYYGGRTLTVPVIDRGPFIAGRDWDLTQAAARQLGVKATVRIGFLPPAGVPLRGTARQAPRLAGRAGDADARGAGGVDALLGPALERRRVGAVGRAHRQPIAAWSGASRCAGRVGDGAGDPVGERARLGPRRCPAR